MESEHREGAEEAAKVISEAEAILESCADAAREAGARLTGTMARPLDLAARSHVSLAMASVSEAITACVEASLIVAGAGTKLMRAAAIYDMRAAADEAEPEQRAPDETPEEWRARYDGKEAVIREGREALERATESMRADGIIGEPDCKEDCTEHRTCRDDEDRESPDSIEANRRASLRRTGLDPKHMDNAGDTPEPPTKPSAIYTESASDAPHDEGEDIGVDNLPNVDTHGGGNGS